MNRRDLLLIAAQLLEEDSQAGRESCMVGDLEWACPDCPGKRGGVCQEKESFDKRAKIAAYLRALA